jgi:hypothetical protein
MNWIRNIVAALVIAIFVLAILALLELATEASAQQRTYYDARGTLGRANTAPEIAHGQGSR